LQKQRGAKKQADLGNLNNLKKMYGDYMTKKEKSANTKKEHKYKQAKLDADEKEMQRRIKQDEKNNSYREKAERLKYEEKDKDRDFEMSRAERAAEIKERMMSLSNEDRMALEDRRQDGNRKTQADIELLRNKHMVERAKLEADLKEKAKKVLSKKEEEEIKTLRQKQDNKKTEGEKVADREFAKEYTKWNVSGRADYDVNSKIFRDAIKDVKSGKIETGTMSGMGARIPGVRTDTAEAEARVRKAINGMLRATLGSQFTEKEGERIFNQT
jgi:hypothetical protein